MSDQQDSAAQSGSGGSSSSSVNVNQLKSQIANKFQANRPLVLKLHSILTWEQDIHPVMIVAFVSFTFLVVHLMNSSVLTTLSYLGIAGALLDLAMPTIAKSLCGSSGSQAKPNEKDNQRFDKICMDLAKVCAFGRNAMSTCCSLKTSKPKLYYPGLLGTLLVFAYVGNKVNNLFLTYLVTLLVVLYPGLEKKGVPQKAVEFVFLKLGRRPPAFAVSSSAGSSGDRRSSVKKN
jgi:hypothetical protein